MSEWRVTVAALAQEYPTLPWIGDDERNALGAYKHAVQRYENVDVVVRIERRDVGSWKPALPGTQK